MQPTRANWRQKHRTAPPRWAKVPSEWGSLLPRTSENSYSRHLVNRPWVLLRACPLHGVDHLLGLRRELIELGCRTAEAEGHRLTLHVLQDDEAGFVCLPVGNWITG